MVSCYICNEPADATCIRCKQTVCKIHVHAHSGVCLNCLAKIRKQSSTMLCVMMGVFLTALAIAFVYIMRNILFLF